jgi:hypothetical protein
MLRPKGERRMDKTRTKQESTPTAPAIETDWAIMLYIAADDTLANFAVESLKQLTKSFSMHSGAKGASVVVAAQFALPLDAAQPVSADAEASDDTSKLRYIFKDGSGGNLTASLVHSLPATTKVSGKAKLPGKANLSEKEALKEFLQWGYRKCKAKQYALILWGHGPELLFQPTPPNPTGDSNSLYLTPMQLRGALEDCRPPGRSRLDIVGFDACSMSMVEMAFELQGLADFMIASQDDVPDLSLPYDNLIELFRRDGNRPASLLKGGVEAYVSAYQDCICNANTGMKPVTLSVLNLKECGALESAVGTLACALLKAKDEACLADMLIAARESSHDYAGGLYVDLHDFCTNLARQVKQLNAKDKREDIQRACRSVRDALIKGTSNFILANSSNKRGHGISIYLPYLTDAQYAEVSKPLVKGGHGTNGAKGYSDMLNGAATEYLMCTRRELILDTESYYERLEMAKATHWYDFITELWTRALIKTVPAMLDYHYSAQQSWINVSRKPINTAKVCPEKTSDLAGQLTGAA